MTFYLDIKYAARSLLKKPAFAVFSVLIVAVGLGLTLYTYSVLNSLIFEPLVLNGDKPIISVEAEFDYTNMVRPGVDPTDMLRVRNEIALFEDFGVYYSGGNDLISGLEPNSAARKYNAIHTEWNIFEFAGVQPILGRGLKPEDHFEGAEPVIVIGYHVWKHHFLEDENIIGSIVRIEAVPTKIIGVMPEGFAFPAMAETWRPIPQTFLTPIDRKTIYDGILAYARLKDDVTFKQFEKALFSLNQSIVQSLPKDASYRASPAGAYLAAYSFKEIHAIQYYPIFISMFVVVFFILLLACINVGNLLLARVNERFKEIAIRVALGVPAKRLILQMMWESVFICTVGGFLAILLAAWGLELSNVVFDQMFEVDQQRPFWWHVALDVEALVVLLIALLSMIVATGLLPAWRALTGDFNAALRDGTRGAMSKRAAKASQTLVVTEIVLSCLVLVIATILLSTSFSAARADYGVDRQNRLTAQLELPRETYKVQRGSEHERQQRKKRLDFFMRLKTELEIQPNITAVGFMYRLPGTESASRYTEIEGRQQEVLTENPSWNITMVTSDSWEALGMKLLAGRSFDHRDIEGDVSGLVISESVAKKYFPEGDAIGQRTRVTGIGIEVPWQNIIGIVSDTIHGSAMGTNSGSLTTYAGGVVSEMTLAMHYSGDENSARRTLQQAISKIDSDVAAYHVQTYDNLIKQPMILISAVSQLFLLCGVMAVFLAASGIYAVAANSVVQRTQEIGVRRALGATDSNIINLFMGQATWQLLIGLSIGTLLSLLAINILTNTIIISNTSYMIGLIGMPLLILVMVLLATYIPTRKVMLMEPSNALHHD